MAEILHRIELRRSPELLYEAITQRDGLAAWWTPMVEAKPEVGSIATFRFGDGSAGPDMEITELDPDKTIVWRCVSGPWVDHEFSFDIEPSEKGSILRFSHRGWKEASDFFRHCNSKWGFFLGVSLKNYLETGKGQPHPEDPDL